MTELSIIHNEDANDTMLWLDSIDEISNKRGKRKCYNCSNQTNNVRMTEYMYENKMVNRFLCWRCRETFHGI